jgi:hypothetical protein
MEQPEPELMGLVPERERVYGLTLRDEDVFDHVSDPAYPVKNPDNFFPPDPSLCVFPDT